MPGLDSTLSAVEVDGISLLIALGLLVMMYPVLAKVRYDRLGTVTSDRRLLLGSLRPWAGGAAYDAGAWIDEGARMLRHRVPRAELQA